MTIKSAICYFVHPGDETRLAGGVITLLASQGVAVEVVCATRGEGVDGQRAAPGSTLGDARASELKRAAQHLGATARLLDYTDPVTSPDDVPHTFDAEPDALTVFFAEHTGKAGATLVLTHELDGHPAYRLVQRAVARAVEYTQMDAVVYAVRETHSRVWNEKRDPAHLSLDVRPWHDSIIAATNCYQTGALPSAHTPENVHQTETLRRLVPMVEFGANPEDAFASLLQTAGAWSLVSS